MCRDLRGSGLLTEVGKRAHEGVWPAEPTLVFSPYWVRSPARPAHAGRGNGGRRLPRRGVKSRRRSPGGQWPQRRSSLLRSTRGGATRSSNFARGDRSQWPRSAAEAGPRMASPRLTRFSWCPPRSSAHLTAPHQREDPLVSREVHARLATRADTRRRATRRADALACWRLVALASWRWRVEPRWRASGACCAIILPGVRRNGCWGSQGHWTGRRPRAFGRGTSPSEDGATLDSGCRPESGWAHQIDVGFDNKWALSTHLPPPQLAPLVRHKSAGQHAKTTRWLCPLAKARDCARESGLQ